MLSHSLLREVLPLMEEFDRQDLARAREVLDDPFGLTCSLAFGDRARAEKDLARLLSQYRREDAGEWRPLTEAPDDLAEGLFAFPGGKGGYQQMVIQADAAISDGSPFTGTMSAKQIAAECGAALWRPLPPVPACPQEPAPQLLFDMSEEPVLSIEAIPAPPVEKGPEMRPVFESATEDEEKLSLAPKLEQLHGHCRTKRVEELEAIVASLREALQDAEAELERERVRWPEIGDFVRCPLTNFFGQVTKVTPRPHGRPWVEIIPYLSKDLPGHQSIDLFDSWELIDPPSEDDEDWPHLRGISLAPLAPMQSQLPSNEVELLLSKLWAAPR
ncbi:hypothetical protein [Microvirga roseola]|uniref:hypothetical protein n=1 Tax=Microvirga roseola TaxID=2883126 RepID=UPI001E41C0E7|nr:hypothetical protein [Microvirga roseola]